MAALAVLTGISAVAGFAQNLRQADAEEANADYAREAAKAEEQRLRRDRSRRIGATAAAFGAAGVTFQGTPMDVLADEAALAEEDALLVRAGGELREREFRIGADRARSKAVGSLLGGAISIAGTSLLADSGSGTTTAAPTSDASLPVITGGGTVVA